MKYVLKHYLLFILFSTLISSSIYSQERSKLEKISSHFYLPFDILGFSTTKNSALKIGVFSKLGVEYRPNPLCGIFFRASKDSRSSKFIKLNNPISSVVDGPIEFVDWTIGIGLRKGKNKFRQALLLQSGFSNYYIPTVTNTINNYVVSDVKTTTPILKSSLCLEYYFVEQAAVNIEFTSIYHFNKSPIWKDRLNVFGVSFGFTTVLF